MKLTQRQYADTVVLSLTGRLDHDSCEPLRAELESMLGGEAPLVLDLAGLEYVSSAGLRMLLLAGKQANEHGSKIIIAAMRPLVAEIFQISRFTMVFEIHPGVREALASASPQAAAAYDRG
jgi:anti-anti-sigma factor